HLKSSSERWATRALELTSVKSGCGDVPASQIRRAALKARGPHLAVDNDQARSSANAIPQYLFDPIRINLFHCLDRSTATQRSDLGSGRLESRTCVERLETRSFGHGKTVHKLLRLIEHLREFGQPPRASGGKSVGQYLIHVKPPVVNEFYAPVLLRGNHDPSILEPKSHHFSPECTLSTLCSVPLLTQG
ncbi:MAG: hypothetical protein ABI454_05090, partial [Sphingomicrobium sp.]